MWFRLRKHSDHIGKKEEGKKKEKKEATLYIFPSKCSKLQTSPRFSISLCQVLGVTFTQNIIVTTRWKEIKTSHLK